MNVQEWIRLNEDKLDTDYERMFVTDVLSQIPEIDMGAIQAQYPFKDRLGRQRYCDFSLIEGDSIKIAVEIDGYDKRGKGGMNMGEFLDWLWRQNGLAHEGWIVLRFANVDVRDKPSRCAEHLQLLLREERSKAGVIEELRGQSESLRQKIAELDRTAKSGIRKISDKAKKDRTRAEEAEAARQADQARIAELEEKLELVERQTQVASDAKKLDSDEKRKLETLNEEQSITATDVLAMKFAIGAFTILLVCAMGLIAYLVVNEPNAASSEVVATSDFRDTSASTPAGESCDNPLEWGDASRYLDRVAAVAGPVAAVTYREDVRGQPTWIDLGEAFPSPDRLVLVIWGRNRASMSRVLNRVSTGDAVCAQGAISEFRGVLQIEIESPDQVRIR